MAPSTDSTWRPPATDSTWPPPTPEPAFHSSPPPPEASWRPPTSPREVASSVVASVQYVTSSVRLLFMGCFQCQSLKGGCWRRQEETDGAWFDCDKLQVEHPYCYINPVALSDTSISPEDNASPNGTVLSQPKPAAKSPISVPPPSPKSPSECLPDDKLFKETLPIGTLTNGFEDTVVYKNGRVRSGLVESFAAKLEADLRRIECDRQRSEGEVLTSKEERVAVEEDVVISFPDYLCPDVDFFKEGGTDIPYQNDGFKGSKRFDQDVWKPSELEDVFECYNMAAFYSYGASTQLGEKGGGKTKGEKFEEVFPATFNNNNNTIKVYRPAGESESPLPLKDENDQENECEIEICDRKREVSEEELKHFISLCVFAESIEEIDSPYFPEEVGGSTDICDGDNNENNHNDILHYGSKSFNKLLIFNLVKSVMADCHENYFHSITLCAKFPVHLVQNKILSVLRDDENVYQLITSGLQAFRSNTFIHGIDTQELQKQLVAERIVEKTVIDELKKESKEWQDVSQEELELKEAISTELFHDLIEDTASIFDDVIRHKLMQYYLSD